MEWEYEEELSLGLKVWFLLEEDGVFEGIHDAYEALFEVLDNYGTL